MNNDNYIICGIDRLGKSTLIENIQRFNGYHTVVHYEKPKELEYYIAEHGPDYPNLGHFGRYQADSFERGFSLLSNCTKIIFDRFHLGEMVYAKRYRGYDGDYVLDLERDFIDHVYGWNSASSTRLILLTTSDFSFIQDDGLSFDFSKKEEEQADFIKAFNRSSLPNKVMVDVSNGAGGYKTPMQILEEALA